MDRETLSLPVANSQFYTAAVSSIASMLNPIASCPPTEKENKDILNNSSSSISTQPPSVTLCNLNTAVVELTEEVIFFETVLNILIKKFIICKANTKTTTKIGSGKRKAIVENSKCYSWQHDGSIEN